jgi:hypothetical protein
MGDLSVKVKHLTPDNDPPDGVQHSSSGISISRSSDQSAIHVVVESHNSKMDSFYGYSFDVVPVAGNRRQVLFAPLNAADLKFFRRIPDHLTLSFPTLPEPLTVRTDHPFEITLSAGDPPHPAEIVHLSWN